MNILQSLNEIIVIQIAAILALAWIAIALTQKLIPMVAEKFLTRYRLSILAAVPILRLVIIFISSFLIISRVVEPTLENLIALLGAIGIALGFAFKDYVSSLIAGIVTLYEMPYRLGDWISVDGTYGEVKSIGMRAVEIVTPDDTVVVIPHMKLWDSMIFNANDGTSNLLCVANFYLHPRHDSMRVRSVLQSVGVTSPFLQAQRPVAVVVQEKPWGTHYRLKGYPVDPRDQFQFISDLTMRGKRALIELGVEFAPAPVTPDA